MIVFHRLNKYIIGTLPHTFQENIDIIGTIKKYTSINTHLVGIYPKSYRYNTVIYNLICCISGYDIYLYDINNYDNKFNIFVFPIIETAPGHVNCSYTYSDVMKKDKVCIEGYPSCKQCRLSRYPDPYNHTVISMVNSGMYRASCCFGIYRKCVIINKHTKDKSICLDDIPTARPVYVCDNDWNVLYIEYQCTTNHTMYYIKYSYDKIYIRHMSVQSYNYNSYYSLVSDKHYVKV